MRIVMHVDAEDAIEPAAHIRHDLRQAPGQRAAVGIAQAKHIRAGILRGFKRAQRKIRIGLIAVEEVLGIVDHFLAVVFQVSSLSRGSAPGFLLR